MFLFFFSIWYYIEELVYNSFGIVMYIFNYEVIIFIFVGYFRYMILFILFINKYEK